MPQAEPGGGALSDFALALSNIWTIAANTFRETIRDKIVWVLAVFALVMILASKALGWVAVGEERKIMIDVALSTVWFFSVLTAVFIGTQMIYKEIDKRTLYTILSKPVERHEFLLGKYLGLLLTTLANVVAMSVLFVGYLYVGGGGGESIRWALFQALILTYVEIGVVTAIAMFFSSVSTPILSAILTIVAVFIGHLTKWTVELARLMKQPLADALMYVVYLILPNLHNFNIRNEATQDAAIPLDEMGKVIWYGAAYSAAVLCMAIFFFRRRNF